MRIKTSKGEMEYSPEVFRSKVSAETYKYANEHVLAMSVTSYNISDYYFNQIFATGALKFPVAVDLSIKPILSISDKTQLDLLNVAAEKKRLSEIIDPVLFEAEKIRVDNLPTPEQLNQQLIESENDQRWKETLLDVAAAQEENPDSIFLIGTEPELVRWEKQAADLGITAPLKATIINDNGQRTENVVILEPTNVLVNSKIIKQTQYVNWLNQIVNYIYKTIYKN